MTTTLLPSPTLLPAGTLLPAQLGIGRPSIITLTVSSTKRVTVQLTLQP